jgi:hypothetical protein
MGWTGPSTGHLFPNLAKIFFLPFASSSFQGVASPPAGSACACGMRVSLVDDYNWLRYKEWQAATVSKERSRRSFDAD